MGAKYTVLSGLTSIAASTTKVACSLATGTGVIAKVIEFAVTFDGTAAGASAIPARVELVRVTAPSSGGSTFTPAQWKLGDPVAGSTARINDTADGTSPTILYSWLVPQTGGFAEQYPLGREFDIDKSDFFELRIITQSGWTTCNYSASLGFEE